MHGHKNEELIVRVAGQVKQVVLLEHVLHMYKQELHVGLLDTKSSNKPVLHEHVLPVKLRVDGQDKQNVFICEHVLQV